MKQPFRLLRTSVLLAVFQVFSPGTARADSTLVFGSVDEDGQVTALTQQIHLREGVMSVATANDKRLMIFDAGAGAAYVVDHEKKKYIGFDPEKVARMAEQFAQTQEQVLGGLEERVAGLPEEQRQRLRVFLDRLREVAAGQMENEPERKYADTGESSRVGDWNAQVIEVLEDGIRKSRLYLVEHEDIGLSEGEYRTLADFQAYIQRIAGRVPAGLRKYFGDYRLLAESGKVPVQIVRLDPESGKEKIERLTGVIRDPIEEGWFTVPEGYERETLGL